MPTNRLFLPQTAVDEWLEAGKVRLVDNQLTLQAQGVVLRLDAALHFQEEVTDGDDPNGLVGKVKTLEAVQAMNGEHYADSVVLGENAYMVAEGFLAEPQDYPEIPYDGQAPDPITRLIMEL